ncbi:Integral membrane protein SED5 [Polyrhizophydium stewartii]|uniref:Integral membrane protein SED5 n=1 Tax=Polyrhizophydium stewartii TaxID=2732419 RepID=A0ABR4MXU0_9FUNG|nr:Syntaxin-5 [Polyrhizophydium stewartii]
MPAVTDRTSEFLAAVDSLRLRTGGARAGPHGAHSAEKARLLGGHAAAGAGAGASASLLGAPHSAAAGGALAAHGAAAAGAGGAAGHGQVRSKSDFAKAASAIGREISSTMTKLQKLTALAKRKSLFDDRPVEINELIYIIKQDIAKINLQIGKLSDYLARTADAPNGRGRTNRQTKEHSHNVITSLQSKLATTSDEFKSILEVRFQNMKEQKSRRDEYSFGHADAGAAGASGAGSSAASASVASAGTAFSDSPLYHPERRSTPALAAARGSPANAFDLESSPFLPQPSSSSGGGQQQQQQQQQQMLMTPNEVAQSEYLESRSQAIESIESTIVELGQIYQNFATLLASQREAVQRIDDNIQDVNMNVEGAHTQLVKYYQNISNNRALMLKVFGAVIFFFLLFVMMT